MNMLFQPLRMSRLCAENTPRGLFLFCPEGACLLLLGYNVG